MLCPTLHLQYVHPNNIRWRVSKFCNSDISPVPSSSSALHSKTQGHESTKQPGATFKITSPTGVTRKKFHSVYPQYQVQPCENLVIRDLGNRSNPFSVNVFRFAWNTEFPSHKNTEKLVLNISGSCTHAHAHARTHTHNVRTRFSVLFEIFFRPISLSVIAKTI
jgi:hypothetical protein